MVLAMPGILHPRLQRAFSGRPGQGSCLAVRCIDPGTVEGHRNEMAEAAETRAHNRRMMELSAEDELRRESLL
jgi:hypothetical protein